MSEKFATRLGRSARETALPLGQSTSCILPFFRLSRVPHSTASVVSGSSPPLGSGTPLGILTAGNNKPPLGFYSGSLLTLNPARAPRDRSVCAGHYCHLKMLHDTLEKGRHLQGRRATAADDATAYEKEHVPWMKCRPKVPDGGPRTLPLSRGKNARCKAG